jgi:deferrochelatase/peroxidase EfeB
VTGKKGENVMTAGSTPSIGRRGLLAGVAGIGATLGSTGCRSDTNATDAEPGRQASPVPSARPNRPMPAHQPGIVDRPAGHARFVAADLTVTNRAALGELLRRLGERAAMLHTAGGGTVTVAFGASLFDERFGLGAARPRKLTEMPAFPNDVLNAAWCHGDLLLQICAEPARKVSAIADDLLAAARNDLRPRWHLDGFRSGNKTTTDGRFIDRNLFGFRDGAGNLDVGDQALMDRLVWVAPDTPAEPVWTAGGTYQAVRLIRFATELWNTEPATRQEEIFGRHKSDGAPLGMGREADEPSYTDDPDGLVIRLDAHIRRANPRTADTADSRILRRGYSYQRRADAAGQPDEGLAFVCFQSDLERGFVTVQRRLAGEALDRYVLTFGGGYYFVPAVPPDGDLGRALP